MKLGLDGDRHKDAVVLLTGGPDSAICQAIANRRHDEVVNVHVSFDQDMSEAEKGRVEALSDYYNNEYTVLDYSGVGEAVEQINEELDTVDRSGYFGDLPSEPVEFDLDYHPMRYIHIVGGGAMVADLTDADYIYLGLYGGLGVTPDTTVGMAEGMEKAIVNSISKEEHIEVCMPFSGHSMGEIIQKGEELGVPWELTYSCYREADPDNPEHCGECHSCIERAKKFHEANIRDPTGTPSKVIDAYGEIP